MSGMVGRDDPIAPWNAALLHEVWYNARVCENQEGRSVMEKTRLLHGEETYAIRGAIFDVYSKMGNGFDEPVYQECMGLAGIERFPM